MRKKRQVKTITEQINNASEEVRRVRGDIQPKSDMVLVDIGLVYIDDG